MNTTHKLQGLAVVVLIVGMATAFAFPGGSNRANDAWSARLTGQAAQAQAQRARDAYAGRLTAQAASLKADAVKARADRANKAWSDRLTGLAEANASAK